MRQTGPVIGVSDMGRKQLSRIGDVSLWICRLTRIGIPIIKISRSYDRLIFNNGNDILGKTVFILKRGPDSGPVQGSGPRLHINVVDTFENQQSWIVLACCIRDPVYNEKKMTNAGWMYH